jgi:hypothetical protein
MDPMKLIAYIAATVVAVLLIMGGLGFYAGYSMGRRDISEVKSYIAAARLNLPAGAPGKDGAPAALISLEQGALEPVMTELKALGESMSELQQSVANSGGGQSGGPKEDARLREEISQLRAKLNDVLKEEARLKEDLVSAKRAADTTKEAARDGSKGDAKLIEELSTVKAQAAQSASQANACQIQVTALENRLKDSETKSRGKADLASRSGPGAGADSGSLLFYDSVTLKRAQSKVYGEVDVALSLEGVAARAARVAINKQSFSISFGERKVFQHNDATCELVLMESDLESNQARFNITCKR